MTSTRFDQVPGEPYGFCLTCHEDGVETKFASREEMHEHLDSTFDSGRGKGHRAQSTNMTRPERIARYLQMEANAAIDSALNDFIDDAARLLDGDAAAEEVTAGVKDVFADPEWGEAWAEYMKENGLDESPVTALGTEQPTQADTLPGMETT